MGIFDSLFGRQRDDPDEIAISYAQALLTGDAERAQRLTDPSIASVSQALVYRFGEAELARWFGRLRSLAAPSHAIQAPAEALTRYIVGRISLPDNAVQDFPILTVAIGRSTGAWRIVNARANATLFEGSAESADDTVPVPDPAESDHLANFNDA